MFLKLWASPLIKTNKSITSVWRYLSSLFAGPGYFGVRYRSRLPAADQARRIPFAVTNFIFYKISF